MTMAEYIEREALLMGMDRNIYGMRSRYGHDELLNHAIDLVQNARDFVAAQKTADVAPVRHARWILEAHDESVNYRWNVTAECSECCDEEKEIWAGFFPNVPDWLARDVALERAKSVKLSNYCPNCGCRMDLED